MVSCGRLWLNTLVALNVSSLSLFVFIYKYISIYTTYVYVIVCGGWVLICFLVEIFKIIYIVTIISKIL